MSKVLGLIAALAMFAALPAMALAQDTVSSGNTQNGTINQGAQGGGDAAGGDGDGGGDARGGDGNAGNQAAIVQQNAGRDANAEVNQSQNFGDVDGDNGHGDNDGDHDGDDVEGFGVGGGHQGGGVGGGHVSSVHLARTGFDAWVLALLGGVAVAGGIGLLAAQRRGRLTA